MNRDGRRLRQPKGPAVSRIESCAAKEKRRILSGSIRLAPDPNCVVFSKFCLQEANLEAQGLLQPENIGAKVADHLPHELLPQGPGLLRQGRFRSGY